MQSDLDLVKKMMAGDTASFDALFERYEPQVRRRLLSVVKNESAAEDLLQEVFLKLWLRAEQWRGSGTLKAWLMRMATNLALNHLRSSKRQRSQRLAISQETGSEDEDVAQMVPGWMVDAVSLRPDQVLEREEQHAQRWALVDALPEHHREAIRMVHEFEMDVDEAAQYLDVPAGTVKSRLHYARSALAREWHELKRRHE